MNADVPEIDASFVEDFDAEASPIGARGIGELGAIGVGPAITNAVFHATGERVRDVPIRPEMLLAKPAPELSPTRPTEPTPPAPGQFCVAYATSNWSERGCGA